MWILGANESSHSRSPHPSAKKQASGCKPPPSFVNGTFLFDMEFRDAFYTFVLVEHLPISPLTAMVVELNSPQHMTLSARKDCSSDAQMLKTLRLVATRQTMCHWISGTATVKNCTVPNSKSPIMKDGTPCVTDWHQFTKNY